jgi:hypothetical protein
MSSDEELEELRRSTERGSRLDDPPVDKSEGDNLVDALIAAFASIDEGEQRKTIAVRDRSIAALLIAVNERESDLQEIGADLQQSLDREPNEEYDRSEIIRLAVRVGLQEAAPEYLEQLGEASGEYAKQNV